ncbi:hypothetical protein [Finegoldia dalianensis]|uniref:hypothetical protein n=1 Tax=Finegoldia dalianensis TaxID=3145239 RepID=UPI00399C6098
MSDLRVFVVFFVRGLDIRANCFSALVHSENFVDIFQITHFARQSFKLILEKFHNDGIIK